MMNVLALGLVLTSLVTAGFFTPSPTPQNPKPREDVIVKEGHRVVVVEYEKDDGNTKVLISPQDSIQRANEKGFVADASEKIEGVKEGAAYVLDEEIQHKYRPRELVCDAYGKCKHKFASAFGRSKEAATEKAHETVEAAKEAASEAAGKVKDTVAQTAHKASHKVQEVKENVKDSAEAATEKAAEAASEAAGKLKGTVAQSAHKASHKVQEAKENVNDSANEVSRKMEGAKEMAAEKAKAAQETVENASDRAKKGASRVRKEGKKELREIMQRAREVAVDVFDYVAPPERVGPVAGVLHMMGFSAAYGMCVWITFASSYVLTGALPRQQFAMVQSKIYPVYFKAMAYSVGMALLGHLIGPSRRLSPPSVVVFQGLNLVSSLAMILTNLLWLEPRATKVMLERMKKEKEEGTTTTTTEPSVRAVDSTTEIAGRGPTSEEAATRVQIIQLNQTLQRVNSYSSFLNALTLVSLTWHLVHLAQRLHAVS